MSKTLKTTKDRLVQLLNICDQVPGAKLATDSGKHIGFRKSLKKHIKDYLDSKAEAIDKVRAKQREVSPRIVELQNAIKLLKDDDIEGRKAFEDEKEKLNMELMTFIDTKNSEIDISTEDLKIKKVEVAFDNEDFLFEKNVIIDNAVEIFKTPDNKFNADLAEVIFELFDSVE